MMHSLLFLEINFNPRQKFSGSGIFALLRIHGRIFPDPYQTTGFGSFNLKIQNNNI